MLSGYPTKVDFLNWNAPVMSGIWIREVKEVAVIR